MMPIRMQTLAMPTMQAMQPRVSQAYFQFDGPPVTVFVGNIAEDVTDTLVRQILMKVGPVTNWKRIQGTNGKLQGTKHTIFRVKNRYKGSASANIKSPTRPYDHCDFFKDLLSAESNFWDGLSLFQGIIDSNFNEKLDKAYPQKDKSR